MAFSDDSGADLESLADDRLGWATPALHRGLDVEDGDTSDHAGHATRSQLIDARRPWSLRRIRAGGGEHSRAGPDPPRQWAGVTSDGPL